MQQLIRSITSVIICLSSCLYSNCQVAESIDVTDQTLKIGGTKEEELYLGFAAGDKIIFNFREVNGKELKEIEIIEYPFTSKFSDYKTDKIENKMISVLNQGVYIFRFKNSSLSGRVCKIHIQRIPANDQTKDFNTAVRWITKQDTSWNSFAKDVLIGYDTTYVQKTKSELVSTEQREELVMDKIQRVHSTTNTNGNRTSVFFTLPQNTTSGNSTKRVVSWAYWVGVGEEANQAWKSNMQAVKSVVKTGATYFATPLGALAIGLFTELLTPKLGEDVYYGIAVNEQNRNIFLSGQNYRAHDAGKGVAGYRKFTDPALCQGIYFICLANDNVMLGIDVTVKAVAIVETTIYEDREYTDMVVIPRYEKKLFTEPIIETRRVPVTGL